MARKILDESMISAFSRRNGSGAETWTGSRAAAAATAVAAADEAKVAAMAARGSPAPEQPAPQSGAVEPKRPVFLDLLSCPYVVAKFDADTLGMALHEVPVNVLADWVVRVVEVEGPVHIDEVCRRVVENAGGLKVGSRISDAIREGARAAIRKGQVSVSSGFLRLAGEAGGPV